MTRTKIENVEYRLKRSIRILELTDGRNISFKDKTECLSELVNATDDLRRIMTGDENFDIRVDDQVICIWRERGYHIELEELGIKMVLPAVLPKKLKEKDMQIIGSERMYARHDLTNFLIAEKERLGLKESFLYDQMLIFTHERNNEGLFDYDNLSTSPYINAISDCFLAADTAKNIDFLQRFEYGVEDRTVIHLIPRHNFAKWSERYYGRKEK